MANIINCLQGTVVEKKGNNLKILLDTQPVGCEGCKIKGSCSLNMKLPEFGDTFYEISGDFDVKKGDYVKISIKESKTILYSFMIFMLPLIFMIIGGAAGFYLFPSNSENASIIGAFIGLILAFAVNFFYSRTRKDSIKKSYIVEKIPSPYLRQQ